MNSTSLVYSDGKVIQEGDLISVAGHRGHVERIFMAGTPEAGDFACGKTGGVLLNFDNGDLQVWPFINEDLVLLGRRGEGQPDWARSPSSP